VLFFSSADFGYHMDPYGTIVFTSISDCQQRSNLLASLEFYLKKPSIKDWNFCPASELTGFSWFAIFLNRFDDSHSVVL
jgi:hypothetical protein